MTGSIENKFKKIHVDEHTGNSNIKIRLGLCWPNILGPIAVVKCGSCGNKYKESLFYSFSPFVIDETPKCNKCGNEDSIHYKNY